MKIFENRIISFLLLVSIFVSISYNSYCQNDEDYAIVYLIRLKKSTNSTSSFNAYIDDKYIGMMNGNNPVFTDAYTAKWLVFNCAAKQKRVLKLTKLNDKRYSASILLNTEKGQRYFIVFDPSVSEVENPLSLIDNKKGYEYLYKAASDDVIVVDKDILEQVKYEKKHGYLEMEKPVNEVEKIENTQANMPIDNLNINIADKNLENVGHKAILFGKDEFKALWKIIITNNSADDTKKAFDLYNFDLIKTFNNVEDKDVIAEVNSIITDIKENENLMIFYYEPTKLFYIGIDK